MSGANGAPARQSIVCFAGNDWWIHNPYTEKQWMRRLAARGHSILFVNSIGIGVPALTSPKLLRRIFGRLASLLRVLRRSEGVWVLTPVLIPFWSTPFFVRVNRIAIAAQVRSIMAMLGFRHPVFWAGLPTPALLLDAIPHSSVVYYVQDNFASYYDNMRFTSVPRHHATLMDRADMVIYASIGLYESHGSARSRACHIPHGVDDAFFLPALNIAHPLPKIIEGIAKPIIGYWGSLESLQDAELIGGLAQAHPEWSIVFIGRPMYDNSALKRLPNLHFLGFVENRELPGIGVHFDVAILPFVQSPWVKFCNPMKLREYYALGLPVVCAEIVEAMVFFPDMRIARSHDEFRRFIEEELASDSMQKRLARREKVAYDTWDRSASRVEEILTSIRSARAVSARPAALSAGATGS